MKKISLKKASELYDEIKLQKKLGNYVCIFIHDDTAKVGYMNKFGVSDFIKNNEPRMIVINECKTSILIEDYYKKDAIKIIQTLVNEAIDEYEYNLKNYIYWKKC